MSIGRPRHAETHHSLPTDNGYAVTQARQREGRRGEGERAWMEGGMGRESGRGGRGGGLHGREGHLKEGRKE